MTRLAMLSSIGVPMKDDVVAKQTGVDVVGAFAPPGLLDHHRHQHHLRHFANRSLRSPATLLPRRDLFVCEGGSKVVRLTRTGDTKNRGSSRCGFCSGFYRAPHRVSNERAPPPKSVSSASERFEFVIDLFVADLDFFQFRNPIQQQRRLDILHSLIPLAGAKRLQVHLLHVLGRMPCDASARRPRSRRTIDLAVTSDSGTSKSLRFTQFGHKFVFGLVLGGVLLLGLHVLADACCTSSIAGEVAEFLGEVVVQFGQILLLHRLNLDGIDRRSCRQGACRSESSG